MVLFFSSNSTEPPTVIYMGRDKVENEDLIKYGFDEDVWFHVDKLSSAHVYLRMNTGMTWNELPESLLVDCGQLVKANSIEGNKKNNITVIYTPWSNLKKTGDMATGAVSFHSDKQVKRVHIALRDNAIVNRMNKTKREVVVDHEAVRQERLRAKGREKKEKATELRNAELALMRQRQAEKETRDYSTLYSEEAIAAARDEKERAKRRKEREAAERRERGEPELADSDEGHDDGLDSDDSFM